MAATLGGVGFMETPLVLWVQTFSAESVGYKDFVDGLVLNNCIMKQIDAKAITDGVVADPEDLKERMHNWNTLLQNIKTYYQEVLQQLIVMKLPNIVTISREPESGEAQAEIQRLLLLLLGCAIQCEKKELFIDNIKKLPINTQHAIVDFIKDITDDSKNVFAIELPSQHANEVTLTMHRHLCSLVDERDGYIEEIKDLNHSLEEMYQSQQVLQAQKGLVVSPAGSPEKQEKQHLIMELAESKAKARKLRQQLEEKTELASELQEEIDELKMNLSKLRNENLQLTQDARAARTYRDELDIVREKASRVDKFESEINKYKEKLNELDFYKARVEELREENTLMSDAKNLLEDQLEASHRNGASVHDLENTVARCRQQLQDMTVQRDDAQERLLELMEENARLELEKRSSFNESASLEEELQQARLQVAPSGLSNSLSEQLSETANAKILRLELENQRLQKQLSESKECGVGENNALVLELEKENHRLAKKVENLHRGTSKHSQDYIALEQLTHELGSEKTKLQQTIETIRASNERETHELEREKELLEHTVETLRQRNEKTHDLRMKDLETENKALDGKVRENVAQLSHVTFEHRQLAKSYKQLQLNLGKMEELEGELRTAQREKDELSKSVVTMQLTCDKYEELERDHSDLEVEKMRLVKVVEGLKAMIARLKTVEQDNINLTVESQQLRRTVENMKAMANNNVDLEHEKDELTSEVEQLKKALNSVKVDRSKQEELHVQVMTATGTNQKLQRSIEAHMVRLERAEKETADLENQNQKLTNTIEEMRVSLHRLDMLERENADLEAECAQLQREKTGLEKERTRLGKQAETKAALLEEATEAVTHLQRQNKALQKTVTKAENCMHRLKDVKQENVTLMQQTTTERKMVSTLREDLVNEKIKTQHLSNELENITEELEKVGLNKEKIIAMEQAEDDSKYKALESMMEDAYQRSMQLKEEKICALQSRLDASRKHNQKLQEDLKAVRNQYEALQQRREEEASVGNSPNHRPMSVSMSSTRDVFELKDHVIAVERANAALEAENNHFKSHIDDLQSRLDNTETRSVKLQMQVSSMQGQQSSQQTQLAKLQVEVTTLQSQNASLASQNAMLQKQLASLESERKELVSGQEELQSAHESLVLDHGALQHLHEQLSSEYEALISEHGSLKANHKSLRSEHKTMQEQQMMLERDKQSVNDAKKILALEKEHLQSANHSSSSLQSEYARLTEDKARLENSHKVLSVDYRDEVAAHKATKTQLNQITTKYDQLQATRSESNGQLTALEFEVSKLMSKCETMDLLNNKLEDENRTLMMQLQALLTQNQELLTQSLDSKDHFHEEQRGYLEKLAELRRQKEKLEEKIMEQYKRYDPVKRKSRGFGATLVRRAKGMMGRRSHSRDNSKSMGLVESAFHNSPENSSLGSGSVGESDSHTDLNYNKKNAAKRLPRHRRNNRSDSPKLAKQNKALAKSTNALAAFRKDSTTDGFTLRGAKSSENLIDADDFSRAGSLSSSNSSARHAEWPARQGKRRQLIGSTSGGALGYRARQSSVSSEDNGQQDDDDMMTLDQFLSECNRSPTSRRKWLQSTGDLRGDIESLTDKCTTDILGPELGPRPAIPQKEDTKHPSAAGSDTSDNDHKMATHLPNSRSELNISRLSQISSPTSNKQTPTPSGGSEYAQWQPRMGGSEEVKTSTPNRYPQYTMVDVSACERDSAHMQPTLRSITPQSHITENTQGRYSSHPVASSDSFHNNSMNSARAYPDINTASYHSSTEYSNGRGGVPCQQNSQMLPRQSSNVGTFRRSNSMKRQPQQGSGSTARLQQQQFNSGTAVASTRNTDAYSGVKRQMSCNNPSGSNGSNTLPKRGSSVSSIRYEAIYSKIPVDQGSPAASIYATSPRRPTTPCLTNTESLDSNESSGSYHPGNVRNLVQSYQQTVHKQASEGPVPPPRRTRPLSAGPGSGPVFTDTMPSHQRPYTPIIPSSDLVQRRTLPQPPDGSAALNRQLSSPPANDMRGQNARSTTPRPTQRGDAPGNTPPRPQGGALDPPKNSIWYEYGCV